MATQEEIFRKEHEPVNTAQLAELLLRPGTPERTRFDKLTRDTAYAIWKGRGGRPSTIEQQIADWKMAQARLHPLFVELIKQNTVINPVRLPDPRKKKLPPEIGEIIK